MTALLLLHGVGLDHSMWDAVRRELPADLAVSAPDLLGHGDSPAAPAGCTIDDLASHALAAVTGPVHVVGFSLGAMVGQHLALEHPQRVRSLTCVSSVHDRSPAQRAAVRERLDRAGVAFEEGVEAALARWFPASRAVDPGLVERTRRVLSANDRVSYLRAYEVFATADQQLAARVRGIRAPVLAITGALDTGSTPAMSKRLAADVPNGRWRIVPDVGHMLPEERPAELADAISHFIKEHDHD